MNTKIGIDGRLIGKRGVGRYQLNLVRELLGLPGKETYVLFVSSDLSGRAPEPLGLPGPSDRLEIIPLRSRNYALAEQIEIPWRAGRAKCALLHFTDNTASLGWGLPMAVTIHDTMFFRPLNQVFARPTLKARLADVYRRIVVPRAARRAAVILTVSEDSRQQIKAQRLAPGKVAVCREGVRDDLDPGNAAAQAAREKYQLPKDYIIAPAAEDKRKNLAGVLEAYGLLSSGGASPALAVFGLDKRGAQQQWKRELPPGARFLGYIPDDDLYALFAGARCLLFPSFDEGFGLPALEAMSLGLPVVAGHCGAFKELCGEAALLVDPGKAKEIAAAVDEILEDEKTRQRLIKAGRERARAFTWRAMAEETLEVYRTIL